MRFVRFEEPTANDGGAYKCTASNELGESNANINLNFAGKHINNHLTLI